MTPIAQSIDDWLAALSTQDGFFEISARRDYAHAEENYDKQYGITDDFPAEGVGLCNLLERHTVDTAGPALEIGCGTGKLTSGMALNCPWPFLLVTDPSPAFLRLTSNRLATLGRDPQRLRYAILRGDDLQSLPAGAFSLVALRSTLHHILNVEMFMANCARALRPGGAIVMGAEPCVDGYVMMAAVAQFIPSLLAKAGIKATDKQLQDIDLFTATIRFYCRQDIDKTEAEDKHLFHPHELGECCARYGLSLHYYPNVAFARFTDPGSPSAPPSFFGDFFLSYLRYCMSFEPEFVSQIGQLMRPYLAYIESCYAGRGNSPYLTGVFLCQKQ